MAVEPAFVPRSWERWGYRAREVRPSEFTVQGPDGATIGWITPLGQRFQARGFAQSSANSEVIGTFESIKAAVTLVIGHFEMLQLRDRVSRAVKKYEAEGPVSLDPPSNSATPGD